MAHRNLSEPNHTLENQIIETLLADYAYCEYPRSHSDMQGCVRNLLRMFEIKRRPLAIDLNYEGDTGKKS